ncbi:hypothetical protein AABB24_038366, partial [Solanum stoloniferum]
KRTKCFSVKLSLLYSKSIFYISASQIVEGTSSMTTTCYDIMDEVCVMLVDHVKENNTEVTDYLKSYNYKVIMVGTCSEAMSMLSKKNKNIDAIIVNVHSPDLDSFKLLAQAVALNIVSLFICDEVNGLLIYKALKEGAYFFLKNPLTKEIVKCVWQFVLREKIQRKKATNGAEEEDQMNVDDVGKIKIVGGSDVPTSHTRG